MKLQAKVILLISPQSWGNMYIAKHHYAIELAKANNIVYFLNPPQKWKLKSKVEIVPIANIKNLLVINHDLFFPYQIKFKWIGLFHFLMRFHTRKILKTINKKIDIVWNFDLGNYYPFNFFPEDAFKIFMPIDEPTNKQAILAANGCQIIFSVSHEILHKYHHHKVPKHFIHHGLSDEFKDSPKLNFVKDNKIRVGLSGNWLRTDVDHVTLLKIIKENRDIIFEFWGSYQQKDSNIGGGSDKEVQSFIQELKSSINVIMHGAVHPKNLAQEFQRMDAFLVCYDIEKDQSKGTNYHKIMEYLSTGKVIISNNITTYQNINLIEMTNSRQNNDDLPQLFKTVINNLEIYNNISNSQKRNEFAYNNSYKSKIQVIQNKL